MKKTLVAFAFGATLLMPAAVGGCVAQAQEAAPANTAVGPAVGSRVMMLRIYVADIDRAVDFYHEVFGATVMQQMGGNVRITTLPGGLPGIILIQSDQEATMNGSWVMQVPDLQAALDRAAAHGGTLMNTQFEGQPGGMASRSSHIVDPDGNIIELLQMGSAR